MRKTTLCVGAFLGLLGTNVFAQSIPTVCHATISISRHWVSNNITFENMSGGKVGVYKAHTKLVFNASYPCKYGREFIVANPTAGMGVNELSFHSKRSYPMSENIAISFPDDFGPN